MKKIIVTFVSLCLLCSFSFAITFSDIEGCWAKEDIEMAVSENLFSGYPDGTFRPYDNIKRIEYIIVVNRVLSNFTPITGIDTNKAYMYSDVESMAWALPSYKEFMTRVNLYGGLANDNYGKAEIEKIFGDKFEPNKNITREEAVKIIELFVKDELKVDLVNNFSDIGTATFPESIKLANKIGITSGYPDGTFRPFINISRAEATKILRTFKSLESSLKNLNIAEAGEVYTKYLEPTDVLNQILDYEAKNEYHNAFCFYDPWLIRDLGVTYIDYMKDPFMHAIVNDKYAGTFTFKTEKVSNDEMIVHYKSSLCEYTFSKKFKKLYDRWYAEFETNMSK